MSNFQYNNEIHTLLMECINLTREQQQNYNNNITNIINIINRIIDGNQANNIPNINQNRNNSNTNSSQFTRLRRNNPVSPVYDPNNRFRINTVYTNNHTQSTNPTQSNISTNNNPLLFLFDTLVPGLNLNNTQQTFDDLFNPVVVRPTEEQITNATEDVSYNELLENNIINEDDTCPIDLQPLNENDEIIRIQRCGHIFRKQNLIQWFNSNVRCPLCRIDIRENNNSQH